MASTQGGEVAPVIVGPADAFGQAERPAGSIELVPAPLWTRTVAALIDTALLAVALIAGSLLVTILLAIVVSIAEPDAAPTTEAPVTAILIGTILLQLVFSWLYSAVLLTSKWQATMGMRAVGLTVTDLEGRRLSLVRATARYAAKRLVVLTLYLGFFMIAATERRQALHDVIAGTLVVRRRAVHGPAQVAAPDAFDPEVVRRGLDAAFAFSQASLPADLHARVAAIRQKIVDLLPGTQELPIGSHDLYVLQRTATDYLPTSLRAYAALPPNYAASAVLPGGKTAYQALEEQLGLLDAKMDEIGEAIRQLDSERLLAHGRFLEEIFGGQQGELRLPGAGRPE